jgi:anti-sigma B factor antagonist
MTKLTHSSEPDAEVVRAEGELDLADVPGLGDAFARAQEASGKPVIADLTAVVFVDSAVLGALLRVSRGFGDAERRFVIAAGHPSVRRTFGLTGLDTVLTLVDTLDDALAAVRA